MKRSGASRGVKLVERLRLGERPEPVDWVVAAAIMDLADVAGRFRDGVDDLITDRDNASTRARFVVRANLVAQTLRQLADSTSLLRQRLNAYFAYRTAEEDGDIEQEVSSESEGSSTGDASSSVPQSETATALEAGGLPNEVAALLGNALEEIRSECGWLDSALEALLSTKPEDEEVLDFLSELEARFHEELFTLKIGGKKKYISAALEAAVGRA